MALSLLCDALLLVKSTVNNPHIVVCGDFNGFNIHSVIGDYADMHLLKTGPTRGGSELDLVATNFEKDSTFSTVLLPLESDDGALSDHAFVHIQLSLIHI